MSSSTFERSLAQRRAALATANLVRTARAVLKRELKPDRGLTKIMDLVAHPGDALHLLPPDVAAKTPANYAETMKLTDVLDATSGIGRVKRNTIIRRADASPSKTLGGMSPRQRAAVIAELMSLRKSRGYPPASSLSTREDHHR